MTGQPQRVLLLGGTQDATQLAQAIANQLPQVELITSFAGRTQHPQLPAAGATRIGGFGGIDGLVTYLRQQHISALVDATHPFAAQISRQAAAAAQTCHLPHLLLLRPAWQPEPGDHWITVDSTAAAVTTLTQSAASIGRRIFLTIGRQELALFAPLQDFWFLMRMIDPPAADLPRPPGELLLARGPFSVESERTRLRHHQIQAIVSKNSGGTATYAKIVAARQLGLPVVMVQRPTVPATAQVSDVAAALQWLEQQLKGDLQ